jgi:Uma2 family endonuclease
LEPVDEHFLYPTHEEENVPEIGSHEFVARYLRDSLAALFPEGLVTGNVCVYWEPGNMQRYAAPDVLVALGRPREPLPRTYLVWQDPPVSFVAEIGSESTRQVDLEEKPTTYGQHLKALEYFYTDPPEPEVPEKEMRLWRLGPTGYEAVEPEANGRMRSEVLGVEFGWDASGSFRVYVDGVPQRTHEEAEAERAAETERRQEAEARVGEELLRRQEAEARAEAEAQQRQQAEALAQAESLQRQQAELRATEEAARRQELEQQLAELRAQLQERADRALGE